MTLKELKTILARFDESAEVNFDTSIFVGNEFVAQIANK